MGQSLEDKERKCVNCGGAHGARVLRCPISEKNLTQGKQEDISSHTDKLSNEIRVAAKHIKICQHF